MNKYVATLLGHTSWVQSISQLHDCAKIISGSRDGMVRAWDMQTITALDEIDLHQAMASADLIDVMQPTTNDERVRLLKKIAQ
jgi:WD40 repeat protein